MDKDSGLHPDKYFYACDGTVIRNIEHLFQELQEMPEHVFQYHVNDEKHDFHNWIRDVFENHELARNIKHARTKDDVLKHVFVSLFR